MKEGRYEYLDKIGEGGMATVYRGIQKSLDRPVAIKVLSKQLSSHPSVRKRFQRESLIVARLNHPNIIHVIDKGMTSKGRPVFVMEFVEGKNLADLIEENSLPFNRKIDLLVQICKGLAYAHKAGIIHRDIKPANVIIDEEGNARLLDFGIASFFEDEAGRSSETNLILGTEGYMAPEQKISALHTSVQSDVYSVGVLMYKLFTGRLPAVGCADPSTYEPKIEGSINKLIMRCLAEAPEDRPSSVDDIKNQLLLTSRGKHLRSEQMQRAGEGMSDIKQKFALLDVIKETEHGAVYLFEERRAHNILVIKKKKGSFSGYKEAKLLTQVKHNNLINIFGTSKKESVFIVVMEYVSGGSLQDRMLDKFTVDEFGAIARQICKGLSFAHRSKVIHGNLRPSNIMLTSSMQVKITDFGFDEHYMSDDGRNWYRRKNEMNSELADIYAVGVIFYQMLVGSLPEFKDKRLVRGKSFVELPEELQTLLSRMLNFDPDDRPQSVDAVLSELVSVVGDGTAEVSGIETEVTTIREKTERKPIVTKDEGFSNREKLLVLLLTISLGLNVLFLLYGEFYVNELIVALFEKLGLSH